jgi:hypothetical protein
MRAVMIGVLCLAPPAAQAEQEAPTGFFIGQYEVIGRDARGPVVDSVRMAEDGAGLKLQSCAKGQGSMTFDPMGEGPFADIKLGDWVLECEYFNDWGNYPLLACQDGAGAKLTFWPDPAGAGAADMACPP